LKTSNRRTVEKNKKKMKKEAVERTKSRTIEKT
jgi:hypothetical protein